MIEELLTCSEKRSPSGGPADAMQKLQVLLPSADTVQLELAIAAVFERFGGVGVADIVATDPKEFIELARRFSDLVRTLPFQLPEDFLLLLRSISLISGVTSALNREFNMWDAVDPFARTLLAGGAPGTARAIGRAVTDFAGTIVSLPSRIDAVLTRLDQGRVSVRLPEIEKTLKTIDGTARRITTGLVFAVLLAGGVALRIVGDELGNVLLIVSALPLLHAIGLFRFK